MAQGLENLSGEVAEIAGTATVGGGIIPTLGKYPKAAFDAVGIKMSEGGALAAAAILATGGVLGANYLMNRNKGVDESEVTAPSTPNLTENNREI